MARTAVLVALLGLASYAMAAQVVAFGDSWGSFSTREFQAMFTSRGYDINVDNVAIGGTTAEYWARNPNSLLSRVEDNPDVEWIWLSIGGNDGINGLSAGEDIEEIIARTLNFTQVFVDPVVQAYPGIKIIQFGYDIVQFGMSSSCRNLGDTLFPDCDGDIACQNTEMSRLQYDYVEVLTNFYPNNHISLDLLGSLQAALPALTPAPYPNYAYYSPEELMNDCIHPNSEGFDVVFDAMWDAYWQYEVSSFRRLK